mgnify:CR=1 FL=1
MGLRLYEPVLLPPQPLRPECLAHLVELCPHRSAVRPARLEVELDLLGKTTDAMVSHADGSERPGGEAQQRTFGSVPLVLTVPTLSLIHI